MTIYRYEVVSPETVSEVNQLLIRGWKPSRETPLTGLTDNEGSSPAAVVILEREDTAPVALGACLGDDIPLKLLAEVPLLEDLTNEELAELTGVGEIRRFAAEDVIFQQGEDAPCLSVILQGEVELRLPSPGVDGVHIMQIGQRDVFGESSFFSGGLHAATANAVNDVRLLVIPRESFNELLQASRPAAWKLAVNAAGILGVRLQETDEWLRQILQHEQDARIAQSWQRFRESAGRGGFKAHRFFGT